MLSVNSCIGNYRVIAEFANGSYSDVYLAQHTFLTRIVAIKVSRRLNSQKEREQFLQEARLLETLKLHPNILPIIDVGIHEGCPYLVTEFAPNGSLRSRIEQETPQPLAVEETLQILSQIGQALQYAHQQNITHRDLKPENILFNSKGDVLLADFGISVVLESAKTRSVDVVGTPPYMAPEQFDGFMSMKSDQYALGCIAYELFTGLRPFTVSNLDNSIAIFVAFGKKHHEEEPLPPTRHNPNLPTHIEQAILRALSKDRNARYPDIDAFIIALHAGSSKTKEQWVNEGNMHYKARRYAEALVAYERAIQIDAKFALAYNGKGLALRMLNRYPEALDAYERAIHLDSTNARTYNNKGYALHHLHRDEEALIAYNQALARSPDYVLAYNNKSVALWELKRYAEALTASNQALQRDHNYADAYNSKGLALDGLNRHVEALAAYEQAIHLDPKNVLAHNNKGNALYVLSRFNEALTAYEQAILVDPYFAYAHNNRGNALYALNRFREALFAYEKAIGIDPNDGIFHNNRGNALKQLGRSSEAQQAYEKALQLGYSG